MNTNFFNQIAQMDIIGDLHITVAKATEDRLVVLVMLQNDVCGDSAKHNIPPLSLRGTAEELDQGFFENITTPMQSASGLMVDMEGYMKQLENTKKQSAMEKQKAENQKKEAEAKDKKFNDAMAKADELEKEGKFREAWMKVPEIHEFPLKAEQLRRRKAELSAKFAPDLFGSASEKTSPEPQREALFPEHGYTGEDEQTDEEETENEEADYWEEDPEEQQY
ncbi:MULTISPECIES: PRTRC system protein E [Flavobacterium]|uniref:PRTRC system protein E n=1 Tax=Flavobacterium TaxID=237 RepID=UPI0023E3D35D|nr:PRTRC system protein E [Flavobacterium sp. YJ01]WET02547.1 PRTRC system protein E [Flavobacterium sp. YJ01]